MESRRQFVWTAARAEAIADYSRMESRRQFVWAAARARRPLLVPATTSLPDATHRVVAADPHRSV